VLKNLDKQVPKGRRTLVMQAMTDEVPGGVITREQPCLSLIAPWLVSWYQQSQDRAIECENYRFETAKSGVPPPGEEPFGNRSQLLFG
jgi:hypothetical protein